MSQNCGLQLGLTEALKLKDLKILEDPRFSSASTLAQVRRWLGHWGRCPESGRGKIRDLHNR